MKLFFHVLLLIFLTFQAPASWAQLRFEGGLDWVPRSQAPDSSGDVVNHSLEFRPTAGLGVGKSFSIFRAGVLMKGGLALASVGNDATDFSILRGMRGGYEVYLAIGQDKVIESTHNVYRLAFERMWNKDWDRTATQEKSFKLGVGGNMTWENSTLPIHLEFGFKFIISELANSDEGYGGGAYLQFTFF